jgi:hypothetical protein
MTLPLNDSDRPLPAQFRIEVLIPDHPDLQEWMGGLERDSKELKSLRTKLEATVDEWLYDEGHDMGGNYWVEIGLEPERDC